LIKVFASEVIPATLAAIWLIKNKKFRI